ncbi:hypothetical protein ACFV6G_29440 [Streptomyces lavendulae]|uniref:hypothetical protein n=1 Tax=Streptomyces lavendulae TaxID=1914 RepID=UPI0036C94E5F
MESSTFSTFSSKSRSTYAIGIFAPLLPELKGVFLASRAKCSLLACEASPVSTMRRPLGHGPDPVVEDQEPRTVRGRTAAERAAGEVEPLLPRAAGGATARRTLGVGPRT